MFFKDVINVKLFPIYIIKKTNRVLLKTGRCVLKLKPLLKTIKKKNVNIFYFNFISVILKMIFIN